MKRALLAVTFSLIVAPAVVYGPAYGYVGVDDPCPVPTPYPPPGAGWASINNASMESGFTAGVADQWIGWKDDTYEEQVHFEGSDRAYPDGGSRSQKLVLSQPPPDYAHQEAGVYQRVYVVEGASYTVTAQFYLHFPPQTYNGEDLLAFLGVDPWGQESGDGWAMVWDEVSHQDTWTMASVTVTAKSPVLTIGVKGTRKWPMHGDGAELWMDALTIAGPVPADPPPGPEPDPVDPETLIPATVGSNLVGNPSFESAYTGGVSSGWNAWSTLGSGSWRRSRRMGKVGPGFYDCGNLLEIEYMKPKTVLLMGGNPEGDPNNTGAMGNATTLAQNADFADTIFVGRPFIDENLSTYFSQETPAYWGSRFADQCKHFESLVPRIDCWQGLNEPGWDPADNWQNILEFEYAFAQRCHELGLKSCSLNLSTGSPGNIWRLVDEAFSPSAHDLLDIADYLGHHVYGGPNDGLMVSAQDRDCACSFALRPRRFWDMYARREWRFPPLIATEGSTFGPWKNDFSPDQVADDCILMGQYMNANRWWAGYTNFANGIQCNQAWIGWDMTNMRVGDGRLMTEKIGDWNDDNPADSMDGLYSQIFGAGHPHPITPAELTPVGYFDGGVNRLVTGLTPGSSYLIMCWMKYEFRGQQPDDLEFYLGVDHTGQTGNGAAGTIDWGADQVADKAPVHEIFTHVWRTFTAQSTTASVWLRAKHLATDPSFAVYADLAEVRELEEQQPDPFESPPGHYEAGWNLTSVPVEPYDPDASDVFADLAALGNVIDHSLYRYNAVSGSYEIYDDEFADVGLGRGYWLYLDTVAPDTVVGVTGAPAEADVGIPLSDGWNMVGHPLLEVRLLADCEVTNGATTLGFADACTAGWVQDIVYCYQPGSGYEAVAADGSGDDDSLRSWYGYWIQAFQGGLTLTVPIEASPGPGDIEISNVSAGSVTDTTAQITWQTDVASTSRAEYGQTASYGQWTSLDPALVTAHSAGLSGLSPGTEYHYRVWSTADGYNDAHSSDHTFWTTGGFTPPVNPGFETGNLSGWSVQGTGVDGVVSGPWLGGCTAHSGTYFAANACNWTAESGCFYQAFDVTPGREYQADVWSWVYWVAGDGSWQPEQATRSRIGLDPTGGSDPGSASIVWSSWDVEYSEATGSWDEISVTATASGASMTVFLYFQQELTVNPPEGQWHINAFDDVDVDESGP